MPTKNEQGGFVALISVIILGIVLMAAVLSLANRGLAQRFMFLDLERKDASDALAQGCLQSAIVAVVNDPTLTISSTNWKIVHIGSATCGIYSITPNTPSAGNSLIKTTASTSAATTNLEVVVGTTNGNIISWKETPTP